MRSDFKYAFRSLLKTPRFSVFAILTFALGIGACTAMFSVVQAVLLKPLPFREPERLVWIENNAKGGLSGRTTQVDNFLEWQKTSRSFEGLAAYFAFFDYQRYTLNGSGEPQRLRGVNVSQNFLDVLGVRPFLGRNFSPEESIWNGPHVIILSHSFWRQQFGDDRSIIGQTVNLDGNPTQVIGVLPSTFDFTAVFAPGTDVQFLLPFPLVEQTSQWGNTLFGIGRLNPTATIDDARAELAVINQRTYEDHQNRGKFGALLWSIDDHIRGPFRSAFLILSGAVFCVQLIACVNLSSLLLTRANGRRKELAVRVALGANRWHLIRQCLAETSLLALGGCALGVPLASMATRMFADLKAFSIPMLQSATMDLSALSFTALLTGATVLVCGLLPALQAIKGRAQANLAGAGQRGTGGKHTSVVRKALVVTEIALACVLLVGASLLIRSFADLLKVNLGFQPEHALAWRTDPAIKFKSEEDKLAYLDRLVEHALTVPGVTAAGISDTLPLGRNRSWGAGAKGVTYLPGNYPAAFPRIVDYRYLQAMNIPLKAGRFFTAADDTKSPKALVINETMAKRLWPDRDALNQIALVGGNQEFKVVGVVNDVRHASLEEQAEPEMYINIRQLDASAAIELVVRSTRPPESLIPEMRAALAAFDPKLPNSDYRTLNQIVDQAVAPRRLITDLLTSFSLLAVLFAAVGLYGVISYSVSQRTKEVGIRLAIGAQPRDVVRLIVGEGLTLAFVGIGVGLIAALLGTRVLQSLLYGVSATDPLIFFLNALIIAAIALLACYFPARRARRINPLVALREE